VYQENDDQPITANDCNGDSQYLLRASATRKRWIYPREKRPTAHYSIGPLCRLVGPSLANFTLTILPSIPQHESSVVGPSLSLSLARNFQNLLGTVQVLYGIASFVLRVESDEPETAGPPSVTVFHDGDVQDLAVFLELFTEGFVGGGPGEFTAFG
jgi:hypothetical protein